MDSSCETLQISIGRHPGQPWGFRLQGGADFTTPLSVQSIVPGSPADLAGLKAGDAVLSVNNQPSDELTHDAAKQLILQATNSVSMLVQRGAVKIWKPKVTPLSDLRPEERREIPGLDDGTPYVQKTSLAADKQEVQHIGSSHNRAPKPFASFNPQGGATNVMHAQYNSPAKLYANESVDQAYTGRINQVQQDIGNLSLEKTNEKKNQSSRSACPAYLAPAEDSQKVRSVSPTLALLQEEEQAEQRRQHVSERMKEHKDNEEIHYKGYVDPNKQSRSFQLLNKTLEAAENGSTSSPAQSGGFRSVKAPTTGPAAPQQQQQFSTCSVCGSLCVGVLVRIKGQPMHPECFKCAKCGLNLKQQGYFTVQGKLYCEADARAMMS